MLSGRDANPIFFDKKIKIGRSEHSLTPHSLRPITSHLCLTPPTPLMWTYYVYQSPCWKTVPFISKYILPSIILQIVSKISTQQ